MSSRWMKYTTNYVSFPLGNHQFKIITVTGYIADNYVIKYFYKCFGFQKKEVRYIRHFILYFPLFWLVISADCYSSMTDK